MIWFANARSVRNKIPDLQATMASMPNTIFALCETWLDRSNHDGQLDPLGQFTVFRKDRTTSRGGGVLVAVPSSLPCRRRHEFEMDALESLFIEVTIKRRNYLVVCAYCPPASRAESYSLFRRAVEHITSLGSMFRNVYILGDFNAQIDWSDPLNPIPQDPASDSLLETMESTGFTQLCMEPTYTSHKGSTSYLDLCFTLDPTLV